MARNERLDVRKTYKLFIGGQFPRTESGRFYPVYSAGGETLLANASRGSRKDVRNAVAAARKAFPGWRDRTAYNRGQILYRMAEMCESRFAELQDELEKTGMKSSEAEREVAGTVDRLVYYAGWADKIAQLYGSVNPVAGPYYNFSNPEPTGVVGIFAPEESALLGLVSRIAPAIVPGNTVVVLTSESKPLPAITLAEIIATSDVPGGVVNLITGLKEELASWLASHMDVNAIDVTGLAEELASKAAAAAADNVKRVIRSEIEDWTSERAQSPYAVQDFLEIKTVWHPVGG
ncbi:MAG: aldehyde dehydrogenase family protein [Thermoanaerobaculia bacterium]|nr:aldehyde dehydrogenase family protein [Thermoanaerobaculia bacterium]